MNAQLLARYPEAQWMGAAEFMSQYWFTPSAWAVQHGLADLEAKVAAAKNPSSESAQLYPLTAQDRSILGGQSWDAFVTSVQAREAGDEGNLGGYGAIIGGAIGAAFGSPQAGAYVGAALDAPQAGVRYQPPATARQTMDARDILRIVASGVSYGDEGLTYDYGTAADRLQTALTPQATPVMALPSALGGFGRMLGGTAIGAAAGAAMGAIRSVSGRIVGFITASGRRVNRAQAVKLAKELGLGAAATALGVGAVELAEAVMDEHKKGRRPRGISARDLRVAGRTMRKVERFHRQLHRYAKTAASHRR